MRKQPLPPLVLPTRDEDAQDFVTHALWPDAELTAQLVSHSAQLRMDDFQILSSVVLAWPALSSQHESWRGASDFLRRQTAEARDAIGSSPLFRRWLHATGRALIEIGPGPLLEDLLSRVNNYTIGFKEPAPLQVRHGVIETWDCSAALEMPMRDCALVWQCQPRGAEIELSGPRARMRLSPVPGQGYLPHSEIVIRNDLPSLRVALDESSAPERNQAVRAQETDARAESYPHGDFSQIQQAAADLAQAWPEAYADWRQTLRVVVPRLPPAGWRMQGFSLSSMQGAIWVHPDDYLSVLESLVHEHSHVKLRYVEDALPLLASEQSSQRFAVGWRSDARPIIGIFEGVYVHIHCAMALERTRLSGVLTECLRECAQARAGVLIEQARDGLALLQRHARFTPAGGAFIDWATSALAERVAV